MTNDLLRCVASLRAKLPMSENEELLISEADLRGIPERLETDQIALLRRSHHYDGPYGEWEVACPWLCISADAAASLGLLAIAVLLRTDMPTVTVRLGASATDYRELRIEGPSMDTQGLRTAPRDFLYVPQEPGRHPWSHEPFIGPWDYPSLSFANGDGGSPGSMDKSDGVAIGFGSAAGTSRIAQLLLDASRPGNQQREFDLESEGGFRGVAPRSAELKIVLPGCEVWPPQVEFAAPPT